MIPRSPPSTLFPYTTLFRSAVSLDGMAAHAAENFWPRTASSCSPIGGGRRCRSFTTVSSPQPYLRPNVGFNATCSLRSEEHTSELQSRRDLVCRLLLEKNKGRNVEKETISQSNGRAIDQLVIIEKYFTDAVRVAPSDSLADGGEIPLKPTNLECSRTLT